MDQIGSLVDTNLRIYPSQTLSKFLQSMHIDDETPENLMKFLGKNVKSKKMLQTNTNQNNVSVELTKDNIAFLNKIKEEIGFKKEQKTVFEDLKSIEKENLKTKSAKSSEEKENKKSSENSEIQNNGTVVSEENNMETSDHDDETIKYEEPYLVTSDIDWLYLYLEKKRSCDENIPYLHDLFAGSKIEMPTNEILKRNPVLEARCVKLRVQQEAREYRQMTKGVDNVRIKYPEDNIAYQLQQINRQLIAILQFVISIAAGFMFGFKGLDWMFPGLDFGFRLLIGIICALVIALAELYFLAKHLNEELKVPETVQLGGPPKFADETLTPNSSTASITSNARIDKVHKD